MQYAHITGWGMSVPESVLTNDDISKMVETNDEWIRTRTGIERRHIAADGQTTVDLAEIAARFATLPPTEAEALRPELKAAQAAIRRCERLGSTVFALNDVYATRQGYGRSGHFTTSDAAGVLKARV